MKNNSISFMIDIVDHKTVQHTPKQSILESIEKHSVEIQYHCRDGYCGACRTKLVKGEVEYMSDPLAFIDDNEILPCCCFPISNIEIQID